MTLMIAIAGGGALPAPAPGEASGSDASAGSADKAGVAFAGVLAGIPDTGSRPIEPKPDRTPTADRTGKRAGESDAELAAMAGTAAMVLLVPGVPAAALALQSQPGPGAAVEPSADNSDDPTAGLPAVGSGAVARAAMTGAALAGTPLAGTGTVSAPAGQPSSAATPSQLPAAGLDPAPEAAGTTAPTASAEDAGHFGHNLPAGSEGIGGPGRQADAGNGVGPVKAMGPANAADAAQAAAAAKIFQGASTPAPGGGVLPGAAMATGAVSSDKTGRPAGGATQAVAGSPAAPTILNHRPAKLPVGAAGSRAAEAPQPAGQPAPGVPSEPLPATSQPGVAAMQQVPVQPPLAGQQLAVTSGHSPQRAHFQPAATADTPLARQVAAPLLALRAGGDGSHQLIVALHPAELGPVNVHVRIEGDLMTIQLASSNETAHDTLRDALPQLRSELQSAGLGGVALSLDLASGGAPGSGAFTDPRQAAGDTSRPARAAPVSELTQAPPRHRTSGDRIGVHSSSGLDRWL